MACAKPPPLGLCDYPSSRAVYAVDLMLKWDNRPDGEGAPPPCNPIHAPLHLPKADHPALAVPAPPPGDREASPLPSPGQGCIDYPLSKFTRGSGLGRTPLGAATSREGQQLRPCQDRAQEGKDRPHALARRPGPSPPLRPASCPPDLAPGTGVGVGVTPGP